MKLLYYIAMYGPEFLGQEIHSEQIVEIRRRGHAISVLAMAAPGQTVAPHQPTIEQDTPVFRAKVDQNLLDRALNRIGKPALIYPQFAGALRQYLHHIRTHRDFDLAHVELAYPMGTIAALGQLLVRKPIAIHLMGGDLLANRAAAYGYGRFPLIRGILRWTLRRASLVRAVSPHTAELARQIGCPADKIMVLPRNISSNSYPPLEVPPDEFRHAARAEIATAHRLGTAPLIVSVGRLLPIKGFDYLIRALPAVRLASSETQLLLIGPDRGDYGAQLRRLAQQCGVADRVVFVGPIPKARMRYYLAAADVVAIPSVEEGGNKMVYEAAAVGTPFVATETSGTPDFARSWRCGLTVPACNSQALAEALGQLLMHPETRSAMGAQGRLFAAQFATDRIVERLLEAYDYVLQGRTLPEELRSPVAGERTLP